MKNITTQLGNIEHIDSLSTFIKNNKQDIKNVEQFRDVVEFLTTSSDHFLDVTSEALAYINKTSDMIDLSDSLLSDDLSQNVGLIGSYDDENRVLDLPTVVVIYDQSELPYASVNDLNFNVSMSIPHIPSDEIIEKATTISMNEGVQPIVTELSVLTEEQKRFIAGVYAVSSSNLTDKINEVSLRESFGLTNDTFKDLKELSRSSDMSEDIDIKSLNLTMDDLNDLSNLIPSDLSM